MLFISHKTEDKQLAVEIHRRAMERGYSEKQVFLDSDPGSGIEAGAEWERQIYASLRHSRAMIVLCSPNWLKSQWCFVELGYAKAMAISIFPVVIQHCDVGSTLGSLQVIDLVHATDEASRNMAFERLWAALEARQLGPKDHLPWPPKGQTDTCPFPGLMYFDEKHAPVYFGREQERDEVVRQLQAMRSSGVPRLLLIVGGSGSGKSSLLRAGVLPWLKHPTERNDWLVLPTLRYGELPGDNSLLANLAEAISDNYPTNHAERPEWKLLRTKFETDCLELAALDFVEAALDLSRAHRLHSAPESSPAVLIPIDQFEELLTSTHSSAQRFLGFLQVLLTRSNGRLLFIGSMRSDYLDVYENHSNAIKPPFLELFRLPPFPRERVTDVIIKPAELVDVKFTDELVQRLTSDAPTSDALPQLAFTLEKLYRLCSDDSLIELREYEMLGGMTGAISQAVKRILPENLSREVEKGIRLSFIKHLAQINDNDEFVRRTAQWSELPEEIQPILEQFVSERLLHRSGRNGEQIEVSHEAIFRSWDRLVQWLNESRRVMRWRRDVHRSLSSDPQARPALTRAQLAVARSWPKDRHEELNADELKWIQEGIRSEWKRFISVVALFLMVSCIAAWGWYQTSVAINATQLAEEQLEKARELARSEEAAKLDALKSNEATVHALSTNLQMFTIPTKIAGSIAAAVSRKDKEEVSRLHDRLVSSHAPTANSIGISRALEKLNTTITSWESAKENLAEEERERLSERVRKAVIGLAEDVKLAWQSQFPETREAGFDQAKVIARKILVEPTYDRALKVTQALADGSREQSLIDEFESLYYSELVFLETVEVANEMIEFRLALRGAPGYEQVDLQKVARELKTACDRALTDDQ